MNLHVSPNEVQTLLLHRIQRAGLLKGYKPDQLPAIHSPEIGDALLSLLGSGWRHDCWAEPEVRIPVALIIPCDLSSLFDWKWVDSAGQERREFKLEPPPVEIVPTPYYLREVRIYHRNNLPDADGLIKSDWRELTLLECAQLLAQSCANYQATSMDKGLGGLTTRNAGIPVEGSETPLWLHVLFARGVQARIPLGDLDSGLYHSEYKHHVAICREALDFSGARNTQLGRLFPTDVRLFRPGDKV
ncbi:MAG: hypothetical protein WEA04_01385 [Candidatus Andersenbacteria bacterium]